MSRMEIYGVNPNGEIERKFELGNSWLGAALVWTEVGKKYLGVFDYEADLKERDQLRRQGRDPDKEMGRFDVSGWPRTWKLQNDKRLTDADWCALMSTFDGCVIPKEHFEHVARCFREFHAEFPNSHYGRCAEAIEKLRDQGYIGYCVNATTVNQNPWWVYEDDPEAEGRPYNVNTDRKHWFFAPRDEVVPQRDAMT